MTDFMKNLINITLIRYKIDILNHSEILLFNDSVHGYSCKQYTLSKYLQVVLLINEINTDYNYGTMTWEEIKTKWDLDNKRKVFSKNNISLNLLLSDIGLPTI